MKDSNLKRWRAVLPIAAASAAVLAIAPVIADAGSAPQADLRLAGGDGDVAAAKSGLEQWTTAQAAALDTGQDLQGTGPCPAIRADRMEYFLSAVGVAPATDGYAVTLESSDLVPDRPMVRCGSASQSVGALALDDSDFATVMGEQLPGAQALSLPDDGIGGDVYSTCGDGSAGTSCQVWWHRDGLAIGLTLSGPQASTEAGSQVMSAMMPTVFVSLEAAGSGVEPAIPEPPTTPPPPTTAAPVTAPAATDSAGGRITFAPGTDSGSVSDVVAAGSVDTWVAAATAGQKLKVALDSDGGNATFDLVGPAGELLADNQTSFHGQAPADGDYSIQVSATEGTANYALTVRVSNTDGHTTEPTMPPTDTAGGRIDSGSVSDVVAAGSVDTWVAAATAGQKLKVALDSDGGNATFDLVGPAGELLADNQTSFHGQAPADGDYSIQVSATEGTANYALTVRVSDAGAHDEGNGDDHDGEWDGDHDGEWDGEWDGNDQSGDDHDGEHDGDHDGEWVNDDNTGDWGDNDHQSGDVSDDGSWENDEQSADHDDTEWDEGDDGSWNSQGDPGDDQGSDDDGGGDNR